MALFGRSLERRPIRDREGLTTFLDAQALALAHGVVEQDGRRRALIAWERLSAQDDYAAACERARWEVYPGALTMAAEIVADVLAPELGDERFTIVRGAGEAAEAAFDNHGIPVMIGARAWHGARAEITRWLAGIAKYRPKDPYAAAQPFAGPFIAVMPVHFDLGGDDYDAMLHYLAGALGSLREAFAQRVEGAALIAALRTPLPEPADDILERN